MFSLFRNGNMTPGMFKNILWLLQTRGLKDLVGFFWVLRLPPAVQMHTSQIYKKFASVEGRV